MTPTLIAILAVALIVAVLFCSQAALITDSTASELGEAKED